jgi:hypothetical protein
MRRLSIDGWRLVEQWIAPDPWSWVYRQAQRSDNRLTATRVVGLLMLFSIATLSCAGVPAAVVPPIVVPPPPVVLVLVPGPIRHDLSTWLDDDVVCVHAPAVQALYGLERCLPMATIRSVILTLRSADQ